MTRPIYAIDVLLQRLRSAWADMDVSAEAYAAALREAGRPAIHFNTLSKLGRPGAQFSASILRDLEDVLLINPLPQDQRRPRVTRRPRRSSTLAPTPPSAGATPAA